MIHGVILSGGSGVRLWPRSRKALPKQFLRLLSDETMLEQAINRTTGVISETNMHIVTNKAYATLLEGMPSLRNRRLDIICEPGNKETATCIALVAVRLLRTDPEAVMVVLPSDHWIQDQLEYERSLLDGIRLAQEQQAIILMGVKPTRPETAYGYIKPGEACGCGAFRVAFFVEKPDQNRALQMLVTGDHLWNSGMFIFRADTYMRELARFLPDLHRSMERIGKALGTPLEEQVLEEEYAGIRGISIDYGILQRTERALVLPVGFLWDDLGSFRALGRYMKPDEEGNRIQGCTARLLDVKDTLIIGTGQRLIAIIGASRLVVVDTPDVLLVCGLDREQEVKELVKGLVEDPETCRFS